MTIQEILKKAKSLHPYKVQGQAETYFPYNEGWQDAIAFIEYHLEAEREGLHPFYDEERIANRIKFFKENIKWADPPSDGIFPEDPPPA